MQIHTLLLDLFASIALISASMVIVSKNPIHSVIYLILVFCNATGLLILLQMEFIAMMFLIIYVGAIAVLFLFVVMMLNIKVNELHENWLRYLPVGGIIGVIFMLEIFLILDSDFIPLFGLDSQDLSACAQQWCALQKDHVSPESPWAALIDSITNIQSLGYLIYTYYFYYFLMASLILLVAMIGAIVLTMRKRRNASKKQQYFKQIGRTFDQAVAYADHV